MSNVAIRDRGGLYIDEAGNTLTVLRKIQNIAAAGTDTAVIAGVANKKIRVLSLTMLCGGTATVITFNSKPAGAGVAISCGFGLGINLGHSIPRNPDGLFETVAGEGLSATTGAGSTIAVQFTYVLVPG